MQLLPKNQQAKQSQSFGLQALQGNLANLFDELATVGRFDRPGCMIGNENKLQG